MTTLLIIGLVVRNYANVQAKGKVPNEPSSPTLTWQTPWV